MGQQEFHLVATIILYYYMYMYMYNALGEDEIIGLCESGVGFRHEWNHSFVHVIILLEI